MKNIYIFKLFLLFLFCTLVSSCASRIDFVLKNPEKYHNKVVSVRGSVISSLSLDDISIYSVKDKSGKVISVVTDENLPLFQDKIKAKGLVDTNFVYHKLNKMIVVNQKTFKEKRNQNENSENKSSKNKEAVVFDF